MRRTRHRLLASLLLPVSLAPFLTSGCARPAADFYAADPHSRITAIRDASGRSDAQSRARLIETLGADDPAVRYAAFHTLRTRTGLTFDYDPWADRLDRSPAMDRWVHWQEHNQDVPDEQTTNPFDAPRDH